ncbi:MAG: hypothetical protein RLZZ531_2066 [Bacteroidota bacterium]|jgi:hypothetical protein
MIPGPTYVYACPDCQLRVSKPSLASGNTFGATHYSDMRVDAPMMPSYPRITKCVRCDCSFWLDETTKVEGAIMPQITSFFDDDFTPNETKNPVFGDQLELDPAKELDRESIKDALFMNVQRDDDDELHLRYRLMWAYHKQLEEGTILREAINEDLDYLENIDAILHLIEEDENGLLFRAELNRYAGRFERSLELLEPTLNDPLWGVISKKMKELCEKGNREVFVLNVP